MEPVFFFGQVNFSITIKFFSFLGFLGHVVGLDFVFLLSCCFILSFICEFAQRNSLMQFIFYYDYVSVVYVQFDD